MNPVCSIYTKLIPDVSQGVDLSRSRSVSELQGP